VYARKRERGWGGKRQANAGIVSTRCHKCKATSDSLIKEMRDGNISEIAKLGDRRGRVDPRERVRVSG